MMPDVVAINEGLYNKMKTLSKMRTKLCPTKSSVALFERKTNRNVQLLNT